MPDFRTIERELVEFFEGRNVKIARAGGTPILAVASTRTFFGDGCWQVTTGNDPNIEFIDLPELARRLADLWK